MVGGGGGEKGKERGVFFFVWGWLDGMVGLCKRGEIPFFGERRRDGFC